MEFIRHRWKMILLMAFAYRKGDFRRRHAFLEQHSRRKRIQAGLFCEGRTAEKKLWKAGCKTAGNTVCGFPAAKTFLTNLRV